jgi:hypothetical protein
VTEKYTLQPASPNHDRPTRRILENDIGLDDLKEALEFATFTEDPKALPSRERVLLNLMNDHHATMAGESITSLMKRAGMLLPDVLDTLRKRDVALAVARSARRIGPVLDGLGEAAEHRWGICPVCSGDGLIAGDEGEDGKESQPPIACPNGDCTDGKIRVMGNLDAAKLFLEVQGLKKSGGGSSTNINVSANAGAKADAGDKNDRPSITTTVQNILEGGG